MTKRVGVLVEGYLTERMSHFGFDQSKPVRVVQSSSDTPLKASARWEPVGKRAIRKRFDFRNFELRDLFVADILDYEREHEHRARIEIDGQAVVIEVGTHDISSVTELDREYASEADLIYRDICYSK